MTETEFVVQVQGWYNFEKRLIAADLRAQETFVAELRLAGVVGTIPRFGDCECAHRMADCAIETQTLLRERPICKLPCCPLPLLHRSPIHSPLLHDYSSKKGLNVPFITYECET